MCCVIFSAKKLFFVWTLFAFFKAHGLFLQTEMLFPLSYKVHGPIHPHRFLIQIIHNLTRNLLSKFQLNRSNNLDAWRDYDITIAYTLLCKLNSYHNLVIFSLICSTLHFSAVKFTRWNEKNMRIFTDTKVS